MRPEGRLDSGLHSDAQDQPRLFSSGEGLTVFIGSEKTTGSKPDEPGFATPENLNGKAAGRHALVPDAAPPALRGARSFSPLVVRSDRYRWQRERCVSIVLRNR